jgi:hypothetical protein
MHDKSRGMVKETSRDKFLGEKKEMEHELSENRITINKLLNERFTYHSTQRRRGGYVVKFQNPSTHTMEKLTFHYENNLKALENLWETQ